MSRSLKRVSHDAPVTSRLRIAKNHGDAAMLDPDPFFNACKKSKMTDQIAG
jgi:hypothetical protein